MSKNHYIIPIFVPHEGCPHNCVFCNQNSITGTPENNFKIDAKYVKETVESYLKTINSLATIEISFFGGTFTAISVEKQKELLTVAKQYKEEGKVQFIRLSTRPDYITDQILQLLKSYSVDIIELGIQSFDEEVLQLSGRGHSSKDAVYASKLIKDYNFTLGHQLMLGLPGDSFEKDRSSALKSISLKPDLCRIYPALVIKDTPLEKMYMAHQYQPYSLSEAVIISKELYALFTAHHIPIIRMGLQPTEVITEGADVITGPFHPAFRELVEGSLYNDMIFSALSSEKTVSKTPVEVRIHPSLLSKLYCDKKKFFNDIKLQLEPLKLQVIQDYLIDKGDILLQSEDKCQKLSLCDYFAKKTIEGNFHNL